jgi:SAM-dependent methyltransferase
MAGFRALNGANMDLDNIKRHWAEWAKAGVDLRATTKTGTIKRLEIAALVRAIRKNGMEGRQRTVLEAGCGNGQNCVALAAEFANFKFVGFDYVEAMVQSARLLAESNRVADRLSFVVGDMLDLAKCNLADSYDVVFTDRAIINLNTEERQMRVISALASRVASGGLLLLLENFVETYERQNDCRELLGLQRRTPAEFNRFLVGEHVKSLVCELGFDLVAIDDFGSLHDLLLYVLLPAVNEGQINYEHPLVAAATELCLELGSMEAEPFGRFGQNRLLVFQSPLR